MKPILILNDVHLGVQRVAGTTPASQEKVRGYLQSSLLTAIFAHPDKDLIIAGDLFDGFTVDIQEVLTCYTSLTNWLINTTNVAGFNPEGNGNIFLMAGNHDIGKRNDRMSSFDVLATLLESRFPSRVKVIREGLVSVGNIHMIPHCMNQDLFNIELEKALDVEHGYLILHANVDNGFAEQADHSLNVDAEWLTKLSKRHHLLFAHEHQHRTVSFGKNPITVLGNQWPSSISDCLAHGDAQKDGTKFMHVITVDGELEAIPTWQRKGDFEEMEWMDLRESDARFIRITGAASAEQAADVISTIARYRQKSDAFVVGNGVKIAGAKGMDELAELTFEKVTSFDVLGALLEMLDKAEAEVVKELME